MRKCAKECSLKKLCCKEEECRMWIDFESDLNCTLIAVDRNGPMTLREIAERHDISIVRAKQILDESLGKIKNVIKRLEY